MPSILITLLTGPHFVQPSDDHEKQIDTLEYNARKIVDLVINVRNKYNQTEITPNKISLSSFPVSLMEFSPYDLIVMVARTDDGQILEEDLAADQNLINNALSQLYPSKDIKTILKLEDVEASEHQPRLTGPFGYEEYLVEKVFELITELKLKMNEGKQPSDQFIVDRLILPGS